MLDPVAWIVLQQPQKFWTAARKALEELSEHASWNVLTGEVHLLPNDFGGDSKVLKSSNIVDILHHALDPGPLEPVGYAEVYRFLPPTSTKPAEQPTEH